MKDLKEYIIESSLNQVDIEKIKDFLIKKYKVSTWEECVDKQEFGTCDKLCRSIVKEFPNLFDYMYDCNVDYSSIAVKKLNELGDNGEMFGNHYILSKSGKFYDFGKGTNTINGVYLLTQDNDMKDKYTINLSSKEKRCIKDKVKRYI